MKRILEDEAHYFVKLAEAAPPVRWSRFRPFKVVFKLGSPVALSHPWIHFDSLISHLLLLEAFGQDYFITPKKFDISPYLPKNNRLLPIKRTGEIYHASVSQFIPKYSVKITRIYKRFEDKWAGDLDKKKIRVGSGHFRSYAMAEPYIACKEVVFYVNGDLEIIKGLILRNVIGLGNDLRIGFGTVRDIIFEEIEEDWSLVAGDIAMRPIPVEMCKEYEEAAYIAYKGPYWNPKNVALCVPPGARCKLKDEYQRSTKKMGSE